MQLALPSDLTRRESLALFAAWIICDQDTGLIPGGNKEIARVCGVADSDHMRETLMYLKKRGYIVRVRTRLFCVLPRFMPGGAVSRCSNCVQLIDQPRAQHCMRCRQAFRGDRVWQLEAVRLAVHHLATKGRVDPPSIAVAVGRPLWKQSDDDDNQSGAVVPFLLGQGFLDAGWRDALKEVLGSDEFRRLRKSRRKKHA
jgi:hypothetical protein